ncbi:GPI ethanolamine phosphate transferase 3 [Hordeum vulgare]|nr:GPI ethanolamine phosphate transferase 3 [Hordeum vulgare]
MAAPASRRRGFSLGRSWPLLFVAILALHLLSIYLFTRGFLLTRTELDLHSHRDDRTGVSPGCSSWPQPAVDRLVIVVLDALRFDFVAPSTFFEEKQPWMDKLQVLQKLAADEKNSARIFKALADPPTTSLQRLKALTTGGLPTFIDVGNSFGAPAIVEDNIMHQLVKNGKRVVMMGDDTWTQLYPEHFNKLFPYPSFNVKDLDTVDNGVIDHLLPSLHENDWDVLIAHFLGVDHAGHIFGVDSTPMIQKLEQYNEILEDVIDTLKSLSTPGGPHENTLLLVMGDHGQTLNGDHGGGTAEEVETSLFAWSSKTPPDAVLSVLGENSCNFDLHGKEVCVSTMQQLDFAVTVSALLGIPFPFGSIGRVNPELYALSAGTWDIQKTGINACTPQDDLEAWKKRYAEALCVKRYIDQYSGSSIIGFSAEYLHHVAELYSKAQANWSEVLKSTCPSETAKGEEFKESASSALQLQIDAYSSFLESFAKLARSAWTEFDLWLMGTGLLLMILSVITHAYILVRLNAVYQPSDQECASSRIITKLSFAFTLVMIRAASLLSNSYIMAEGRVTNFLLATSCIAGVWSSAVNGNFNIEEFIFLLLNIFARFGIELGMSKQIAGPTATKDHPVSIICDIFGSSFCNASVDIFPIISLAIVTCIILKLITYAVHQRFLKYFIMSGTILSYAFIANHWASESTLLSHAKAVQQTGRSLAPRFVYAIGGLSLVISALWRLFAPVGSLKFNERITSLSAAMLCSWSPVILMLLGRQGAFVALICITGAWCIIMLQQKYQKDSKLEITGSCVANPVSVTQWSLLAVCLFYLTGHWCTFDGLRYGAAFIGFDNFHIIRQGFLLSVDTFGVSHILPVLSLPFIAIHCYNTVSKKSKVKDVTITILIQVHLMYGLITAITTTVTIICVTIQRRHLMVWGLFAPKYVFDAIGLLVTDLLICLASLYYS